MVLDTGDKVRSEDRDPHMKGTTTFLRLLHKHRPGDDDPGEHLTLDSGEPIHLFQGFSLANYFLCSRVPEGSSKGVATVTMKRNCSRHFKKTIDILEPTVLILTYQARDRFDEAYHLRWNTVDNYELLDLDGRQTSVRLFLSSLWSAGLLGADPAIRIPPQHHHPDDRAYAPREPCSMKALRT